MAAAPVPSGSPNPGGATPPPSGGEGTPPTGQPQGTQQGVGELFGTGGDDAGLLGEQLITTEQFFKDLGAQQMNNAGNIANTLANQSLQHGTHASRDHQAANSDASAAKTTDNLTRDGERANVRDNFQRTASSDSGAGSRADLLRSFEGRGADAAGRRGTARNQAGRQSQMYNAFKGRMGGNRQASTEQILSDRSLQMTDQQARPEVNQLPANVRNSILNQTPQNRQTLYKALRLHQLRQEARANEDSQLESALESALEQLETDNPELAGELGLLDAEFEDSTEETNDADEAGDEAGEGEGGDDSTRGTREGVRRTSHGSEGGGGEDTGGDQPGTGDGPGVPANFGATTTHLGGVNLARLRGEQHVFNAGGDEGGLANAEGALNSRLLGSLTDGRTQIREGSGGEVRFVRVQRPGERSGNPHDDVPLGTDHGTIELSHADVPNSSSDHIRTSDGRLYNVDQLKREANAYIAQYRAEHGRDPEHVLLGDRRVDIETIEINPNDAAQSRFSMSALMAASRVGGIRRDTNARIVTPGPEQIARRFNAGFVGSRVFA